jgi:hypothetical protein
MLRRAGVGALEHPAPIVKRRSVLGDAEIDLSSALSASVFTRRAGLRHVAGKATAAFDFKLTIFDGPGDEAWPTDQEAPALF